MSTKWEWVRKAIGVYAAALWVYFIFVNAVFSAMGLPMHITSVMFQDDAFPEWSKYVLIAMINYVIPTLICVQGVRSAVRYTDAKKVFGVFEALPLVITGAVIFVPVSALLLSR